MLDWESFPASDAGCVLGGWGYRLRSKRSPVYLGAYLPNNIERGERVHDLLHRLVQLNEKWLVLLRQ